MNILFLQYPKCGTCKKAAKWLNEHGIEVQVRDITLDNPSEKELTDWIRISNIPVAKFFNTSGLKYRELNMKDQIKLLSNEKLIASLSSDGMLVKRPIVIRGGDVLIGFNEQRWEEVLLR